MTRRPVCDGLKNGRIGGMRQRCRRALAAVVFALVVRPAYAAEQSFEAPELFYRLSTEVVTPHIAWAKPLPGKRLRALVIGMRWSQRETVELMQRCDIDCTPVMVFRHNALYTTQRGWGWQKIKAIWKDEALAALRRGLSDSYDVIIMGHAPVGNFPPDVIDKLKQHVEDGTGLVYSYHSRFAHAEMVRELTAEKGEDEHRFVTTGVPFEKLPGFRVEMRESDIGNAMALHRFGKGRVVLFKYAPGSFLTPNGVDDLRYEYYQSFLIKAILWATRREPGVLFGDLPRDTVVRGHMGPGEPLAIELLNRGEATDATLVTEVRSLNPDFSLPAHPFARPGVHETGPPLVPVFAKESKLRLASGANPVTVDLAPLPAGDYFVDLRLSSEAGTLNWATVELAVEVEPHIANVNVTPAVVDLAAGPPEVTVEVLLSGRMPSRGQLHLAVLDNHDRLLSARTVTLEADQDKAQAKLPVGGIRSTLGKVRAQLNVGNAEGAASIAGGRFTVVRRPWPDFTFFAWGGGAGPGYVMRQKWRMLATLGVDAFRGGLGLEGFEAVDVRGIPDLWRFTSNAKDGVREPCYRQAEQRASLARTMAKVVEEHGPFDPAGYLYGDEFQFVSGGSDVCSCDTCVPSFRAYLANEYGTIDALNDTWGTDYPSFGDVTPMTREEVKQKAETTGSYAPLIDQWLHNYDGFADTMRFCSEALRKLAPTARIGGSTPLWNWWFRAYDWARLMPHFTVFTPYGPWGDISHYEVARSFARPGTLLSMHFGSYVGPNINNEAHFRLVPYVILLHGFSNAFWYTTWGDEGGMAPSLEPYPCIQSSSDEIRKIKNGIGRLFLGGRRLNDGIAIHYSTSSDLFSFLASGPAVAWRLNALIYALEHLGFQYDFVSREQILAGELSNYRTLLLPMSQCIGPREGRAIRQFVEAGGLAVADVRPGIADQHGKVGARNGVADLFGLQWKQPLRPLAEIECRFEGVYRDARFAGPLQEEVFTDRSMVLDGAEAALTIDETPYLAHRQTGGGTAVCLNTFFDHNLLGVVLSAHGIKPPVRMEKGVAQFSPGAWMPGLEVARFVDREARYFGLTRMSNQEDAGLVLRLGDFGELYDIRAGTHLGRRDALRTSLGSSDVALYAVLPYRVGGLKVELTSDRHAPGKAITGRVILDTGGLEPVRHVINVQVTRPDGETVEYLSQNLETRTGRVSFEILLCLNEPGGNWRVSFVDVATGTAEVVDVRVTGE